MTTKFDMSDVSDQLLGLVESGVGVTQCQRIWIHSHPGAMSTNPSMTDEDTFRESFGDTDWAVMMIINQVGQCYCRLRTEGIIPVTAKIRVRYEDRQDLPALREGEDLYLTKVTDTSPILTTPTLLTAPGELTYADAFDTDWHHDLYDPPYGAPGPGPETPGTPRPGPGEDLFYLRHRSRGDR